MTKVFALLKKKKTAAEDRIAEQLHDTPALWNTSGSGCIDVL